ncbi:hypothetical protein SNK05_13742 [Fusarium graminearum]
MQLLPQTLAWFKPDGSSAETVRSFNNASAFCQDTMVRCSRLVCLIGLLRLSLRCAISRLKLLKMHVDMTGSMHLGFHCFVPTPEHAMVNNLRPITTQDPRMPSQTLIAMYKSWLKTSNDTDSLVSIQA